MNARVGGLLDRIGGRWIALGTAVVSGVSVFVNSYGVKAFGDATAYTTGKNVVAALVLLLGALAVGAGRPRLTRPETGGQWAALLAIGVIGGSVPFVLFFEGLAAASSGPVQAALIHKTLVVWVALMAVPLLGERLRPVHLAAIALLVGGQVVLAGGLSLGLGRGELMVLAATLMWAVEVVVAKRLLHSVSAATVGLARMALGSVVLLAWLAVRGGLGSLVGMSSSQLGWVLLTGALLAAYVATWFAALARAHAVDVTAVLVVAVVVTSLLQAVVDGKSLVPQLVGLGLVLLGTAAVLPGMARRQPSVGAAPAG